MRRRSLSKSRRRHVAAATVLGVSALLASCAERPAARATEAEAAAAAAESGPAAAGTHELAEAPQPPAAPGALAPHLAAGGDGDVLLSWLEPTDEGHRLRVARLADGAWGEAATVASGGGFFANWADTPSVVADGEGGLWAHWLQKLGEGTYAYGVELARSTDGGATWRPLGLLHDDRTPAEHGFVSLLPAAGGGVEAVWLDGRAMAEGGAVGHDGAGHDGAGHGGATALRTRRLDDGADGGRPATGTVAKTPEAVIDPRVCDCCSTAAAATADGLLVAYRDRSEEEVRDIALARRGAGGGWSAPRPLHRDGWTIPGCPVNGPALAADGRRVAAAWFTAADGRPRVLAARSADAGDTWSAPAVVDAEAPLGRVGLALLPDGAAIVSWLAADGAIRLRRQAPDGRLGEPLALAVTATSRAAGVPRLLALGDRLHAAWVDPGAEGSAATLRFASLPAAAVP